MEGTLNQPYVALLCICLGAAGGLAADVLRVLGRLLGGGRVLCTVLECLGCLVYGAGCLYVWFGVLQLKLRVYYALAMALGVLLYRGGAGKLLLVFWRKIAVFFAKNRQKKR